MKYRQTNIGYIFTRLLCCTTDKPTCIRRSLHIIMKILMHYLEEEVRCNRIKELQVSTITCLSTNGIITLPLPLLLEVRLGISEGGIGWDLGASRSQNMCISVLLSRLKAPL